MADKTAHDLADLVSHVFPQLPCSAAARTLPSGSAGSQRVALKRRDGDRLLGTWAFSAPMPGDDIGVYVVRDEAVCSLAARITGVDRGTARFLTVTELRRRTQRRSTPRAQVDALVLVSHRGDVDATLVDVSAHGVTFLLDRSFPVEATIKAVINFHGSVIPTTARVRNITATGGQVCRVGCAFTHIGGPHRALLDRYAHTSPADRRSPATWATEKLGLRHRVSEAA